jgi:hypothetical protein
MIIHYLIRTGSAPDKPDEYHALCGYTSCNPKEFTSASNPSMAKVTHEGCLEKAHIKLELEETWTIKS